MRQERCAPGDQLPTVRQLAVDLAINPNTVVRAYRELEIREVLATQQGTGTFLTDKKPPVDGVERGAASGKSVANFWPAPGRKESSWRTLSAI